MPAKQLRTSVRIVEGNDTLSVSIRTLPPNVKPVNSSYLTWKHFNWTALPRPSPGLATLQTQAALVPGFLSHHCGLARPTDEETRLLYWGIWDD